MRKYTLISQETIDTIVTKTKLYDITHGYMFIGTVLEEC